MEYHPEYHPLNVSSIIILYIGLYYYCKANTCINKNIYINNNNNDSNTNSNNDANTNCKTPRAIVFNNNTNDTSLNNNLMFMKSKIQQS